MRDEMAGAIADGLPQGDEFQSFCDSKDFDRLITSIIEIVGDHIDYNLDTGRILE